MMMKKMRREEEDDRAGEQGDAVSHDDSTDRRLISIQMICRFGLL